jgi:hypothetical protein
MLVFVKRTSMRDNTCGAGPAGARGETGILTGPTGL